MKRTNRLKAWLTALALAASAVSAATPSVAFALGDLPRTMITAKDVRDARKFAALPVHQVNIQAMGTDAAQIYQSMLEAGASGVTVPWGEGAAELLGALRDALLPGQFLTLAVEPGDEVGEAAHLADQIILMDTDQRGFDRITGHMASLAQTETAVDALIEGGVPAEKILLGIPAQGRVWRDVTGGGDGKDQRSATSGNRRIAFEEVLKLEQQGYTRYWDEKARAAWWFNGVNFVSAEEERSIAAKGEFVMQRGLAGMAILGEAGEAFISMVNAAMR